MSTTTTVTTAGQSGSGTQKIEANDNLDYSTNKEYTVNLSDLLPSDATVQKIIVNLTASGDIGTMSCGGGITLSGGNWQTLNCTQNGTGSSVQAVFDVSDYGDNLEMSNGVFKFSYWWGNQQTITVDSVVCEYTGGEVPIVTTASTAPIVTTTTPATGDIDWSAVMYGDVNLDNDVSIADIAVLTKHVVSPAIYGLEDATAVENADVNHDSSVTSADIQRLIEFILKTVSSLDK